MARRKWTYNEILYLRQNYHKLNILTILNYLNRSYKSVCVKANRLNLLQDKDVAYESRTFKCDNSFFNKPNLLNSYWAGFIGADGCIIDNILKIHISAKDKILLDRFKNDINFEGNINFVRKRGRTKKSVTLSITNRQIVNDLRKNFNIIERKSLTLQPPILKGDLAYAYIIGNLDGDGSIFKKKSRDKRVLAMKFTGTYSLVSWIRDKLSKIHIINNKIHEGSNVFYFSISCRKAIEIGQFLDGFPIAKLNRKWDNINV